MQILEQAIADLHDKVISGVTIFKLYDTYGFPADLTGDIARERGLSLDMAGFDQETKEFTLSMAEPNGSAYSYYGVAVGNGKQAAKLDDWTQSVLFDHSNDICLIGLNRPGKRNAVRRGMQRPV